MEKYKCKRCSRTFSNGRALGGHMKSHLTNFPIPPKHKNNIIKQQQSSTETAAASWSSNSDDDEVEEQNPSSSSAPPTADFDRDQENPRPRTSPAPDSDFLGIVLQDRESETETNRNPTRRRSKRSRKQRQYTESKLIESTPGKKVKHGGQGPVRSDSVTESIPVSSVSDGSMMITKEDEEVALSLMMLSLGKWDEKEYNDTMQGVNNRLFSPSSCKKVSDELGSSSKSKELVVGEHKHNNRATVTVTATTTRRREIVKKIVPEEASEGDRSVDLKFGKVITEATTIKFRSDNVGGISGGNVKKTKKIYECPYCNKVFESGQALGGHKRSHLLYGRVSTVIVGPSIAKEVEVAACGGGVDGSSSSSAAVNACSSSNKRDESCGWIDLNLPAPLEEDSNDHALKPVIF